MFNTKKLEELKNSALIVRNAVEGTIINTRLYEDTIIKQAIAVFTICDEIVSNMHDYLTDSEEYGDRNLALFLGGMYYLLRSIHADGIGYYEEVLECCGDNVVTKHFGDMYWSLKNNLYYK